MTKGIPPDWSRVWAFSLHSLAIAVPVWSLTLGLLMMPTFQAEGFSAATFGRAATFFFTGLLLNVPANAFSRWAQGRRRRSLLHPLGIAGFAILWAALAAGSMGLMLAPHTMALHTAIAGALFYGTHAIKQWRSKQRLELLRRRLVQPNVLQLCRVRDVDEVAAALARAKGMAGEKPGAGARLVEALDYQFRCARDSRFQRALPLPAVMGYLVNEIRLKCRVEEFPCALDVGRIDQFPEDRFIEPSLVCALGYFAAAYGAFHKPEGARLRVLFERDTHKLVFQTDLALNDLWFALPEGSVARLAKEEFLALLNRTAGARVFETVTDVRGCLEFRLRTATETSAVPDWDAIEQELGPVTLLSLCPESLGVNRVYQSGGRILKVERDVLTRSKQLSLGEEYQILKRIEGIPGVPQHASYEQRTGYNILSYARLEGEPFARHLQRQRGSRPAWFRAVADLTMLLDALHVRGLLHRDIRSENVLVSDDGRVSLIDFDQSVTGAKDSEQVDFTGEPSGDIVACRSVRDMIRSCGLEAEFESVTGELQNIWDRAARSNASSPGVTIAYYQWRFAHLAFAGERPWMDRWRMIHAAIRPFLPGARILDLGCNLGLLSTHLKLYGAGEVTGVDMHADIIECARHLAAQAGVQVSFRQADLNRSEDVAPLLAQTYDLAIALSVVHWLKDREPVAQVLKRAARVLYEGHSPYAVEAAYLRDLGFDDIQIIGYSERLRVVYLAARGAKSSAPPP